MLDVFRMPKQVVILNDVTFWPIVSEMPTLCVFGTLWCEDTKRILTKALPDILEKYGESVRFCFVIMQCLQEDNILCPVIKKEFGITRYPSIAGFVDGKIVHPGIVISEGNVESQLQDLEAVCRLVLG
ncbi:MAG: hypothetical protein PHW24_04825 [Candidatus Moranbacteria bacterium]|nr:hypothetical protein [Candidatus Moranbacteria bacterium]